MKRQNMPSLSVVEKRMKRRRFRTKKQVNRRNWADLPQDVVLLILTKVGEDDTYEIIRHAQKVCSSWWKLAKEPSLYRRVVIRESRWIPKRISGFTKKTCGFPNFAKELVDRSRGQMEKFSCDKVIYHKKDLLKYIIGDDNLKNSLKSLELFLHRDEFDQVAEIAKGLPLLEELNLCCWFFPTKVIEQVGPLKNLKHLRLHYLAYMNPTHGYSDQNAVAIATYSPQLRRLHLIKCTLTYDGLQAILNGCSHLESLHLKDCPYIDPESDLLKKCVTDMKLELHAVDDAITLCRSPKQGM